MKHTLLFLALLAGLTACQQAKDKSGKTVDTPTTGEINIMVDEGYRPIIESSIDVFDSIYFSRSLDDECCVPDASLTVLDKKDIGTGCKCLHVQPGL